LLSRAWQRGGRVEDTLVLKSAVLREKVTAALFEWDAVFLVVPEGSEPLTDARTFGNSREMIEGQLILRFDPLTRRRRIEVLELTDS
jgi:hypothetical protein